MRLNDQQWRDALRAEANGASASDAMRSCRSAQQQLDQLRADLTSWADELNAWDQRHHLRSMLRRGPNTLPVWQIVTRIRKMVDSSGR